MKLFKTTLLSILVIGLACTNISAMNHQDNKEAIVEAQEQDCQLRELSSSEALKEALEIAIEKELSQQNDQKAPNSSHAATSLGWLGLTTISGIVSYQCLIWALSDLNYTIQNIGDINTVCGHGLSSQIFSSECFSQIGPIGFRAALALIFSNSAQKWGRYSLTCLFNALDQVRAAITE